MNSGELALVNYGEVPVIWHTRLLLSHTTASNWIILTPDHDRYEEQLDMLNSDFTGFEYLGHTGVIPAHIPAASVYGFDDLSPAVLAYHMGQARIEAQAIRNQRGIGLAAPAAPAAPVLPVAPPAPPPPPPGMLGAAGPVAPAVAPPAGGVTHVWVATEASGGREKGEIICVEPAPLPPGHVVIGDRGVIPDLQGRADGCFVRRVPQDQAVTYKLDDFRTLPVHFDVQGLRRRDFSSAVPLMVEGSPKGGGLQLEGPASALGIAKSLRDQAMTPSSYHEFWIRSAEIPKGDRSVYEHECLSRIFESMICVDQLNPSGLQSAELVVRRMQVIREAHRISPSAPDYSAADIYMGWQRRRGVDSELAAHVANQLKAEAAIAKESRKAREEQQSRRKPPGKKDAGGGGESK